MTHILKKTSRGFTLIEMIVVVGIMVLVSGIMLANHGRFGEQILLRNLAYDIALTFHEAQVYGISSRRIGGAAFSTGQGISIDMATPTVLTRFSDINGDALYTQAGNEWAGTYQLSRAYRVETICGQTPSGEICGLQKIHVLFTRPEPDATVFGENGGSLGQYSGMRVILISPREDRAVVLVESSGQISVDRYTP